MSLAFLVEREGRDEPRPLTHSQKMELIAGFLNDDLAFLVEDEAIDAVLNAD